MSRSAGAADELDPAPLGALAPVGVARLEEVGGARSAPARGEQGLGQAGVEEWEPAPLVDEARLGEKNPVARLRGESGELPDEALVVGADLLDVPGLGDQGALLADGSEAGPEGHRRGAQPELAEHRVALDLAVGMGAEPQARRRWAESRP